MIKTFPFQRKTILKPQKEKFLYISKKNLFKTLNELYFFDRNEIQNHGSKKPINTLRFMNSGLTAKGFFSSGNFLSTFSLRQNRVNSYVFKS